MFRDIRHIAGEELKPTVLGLGGKAPVVVLERSPYHQQRPTNQAGSTEEAGFICPSSRLYSAQNPTSAVNGAAVAVWPQTSDNGSGNL